MAVAGLVLGLLGFLAMGALTARRSRLPALVAVGLDLVGFGLFGLLATPAFLFPTAVAAAALLCVADVSTRQFLLDRPPAPGPPARPPG